MRRSAPQALAKWCCRAAAQRPEGQSAFKRHLDGQPWSLREAQANEGPVQALVSSVRKGGGTGKGRDKGANDDSDDSDASE